MTATEMLLEAFDHMVAALKPRDEALAAAAAFREAIAIAAAELDDYRDAFPLLRDELADLAAAKRRLEAYIAKSRERGTL